MNEVEQLRQIIQGSDNIVFFGGAGVSTESQIPDFRSEDGLYHSINFFPLGGVAQFIWESGFFREVLLGRKSGITI